MQITTDTRRWRAALSPCYAAGIAFSRERILDALNRLPFIDAVELALILGEPPDKVPRALTGQQAGDVHVPFYFEHVPEEDKPAFTLRCYWVNTDEVAETYVGTAPRMVAMLLHILVSNRKVLACKGILVPCWRPMWDAEHLPLGLRELGDYGWNALHRRMRGLETSRVG